MFTKAIRKKTFEMGLEEAVFNVDKGVLFCIEDRDDPEASHVLRWRIDKGVVSDDVYNVSWDLDQTPEHFALVAVEGKITMVVSTLFEFTDDGVMRKPPELFEADAETGGEIYRRKLDTSKIIPIEANELFLLAGLQNMLIVYPTLTKYLHLHVDLKYRKKCEIPCLPDDVSTLSLTDNCVIFGGDVTEKIRVYSWCSKTFAIGDMIWKPLPAWSGAHAMVNTGEILAITPPAKGMYDDETGIASDKNMAMVAYNLETQTCRIIERNYSSGGIVASIETEGKQLVITIRSVLELV